jgi:ssDNA-binding Zn-finger/Zn-ribbon topoisomerase 1
VEVHLVIFPVSKNKMPFIEESEINEKSNDHKHLKVKLFNNLHFMVPSNSDDCKYMAKKGFWGKHKLFIFCENSVNHKVPQPDDVVLSHI